MTFNANFWETIARRGIGIPLCSAEDTFPDVPVSWGSVADWRASTGAVSFDLEIWSDEPAELTNFQLLGAVLKFAPEISNDDLDDADAGDDTLEVQGHAYRDGDGPFQITSTLTLPGGVSPDTNYWIGVVDEDNIQLYLTFADWLSRTTPVDITSDGTGDITIAAVEDQTMRVHWMSYGLLGDKNDGAISCDEQIGHTQRISHRPRTIAYGLVGDTTGEISAEIIQAR